MWSLTEEAMLTEDSANLAQRELLVLKESIEFAVRESTKKCKPVYLVYYRGNMLFEKEKPPIGTCVSYLKVEDENIYKVDVNLSNGKESQYLFNEDFEYIAEDKVQMRVMPSPEPNEPGVIIGYEVKKAAGKKYFSFDGGASWEGKKEIAYQKAKGKKDRRLSKKDKGGMGSLYPESSAFAKEILKVSKSSGLKESAPITEATKMNQDDLDAMAAKGSGFGFFGHQIRDPKEYKDPGDKIAIRSIDKAFIEAANELDLATWQTAAYGDSVTGRSDADKLAGKIMDLDKTGEDLYLKAPETVFKTSYDFFMIRMKRFVDQLDPKKAEELKTFWEKRLV